MDKSYFIIILSILILISMSSPVLANKSSNSISIQIGNNFGYTQFEINGYDSNGQYRSVLEFPLNVRVFSLEYEKILKKEILNIKRIQVQKTKNITEEGGTFKDSDWIGATGIHIKDIEGISSTRVEDLNKWDFRLVSDEKNFFSSINGFFHIGYKYNYYELVTYNTTQTALTDNFWAPEGTSIYIPGDSIKYKVVYNIPYLGLSLYSKVLDNIVFSNNFSYSPMTTIRDEDHHLHRNLVVKGNGQGNSFSYKGEILYNLDNNLKIKFQGSYHYSKLEGKQDQYHTNAIIKNINYLAKQENYQFKLGLMNKF
ncbi:MAG: omptin family outer membrane protease [Bacillota bacterium]